MGLKAAGLGAELQEAESHMVYPSTLFRSRILRAPGPEESSSSSFLLFLFFFFFFRLGSCGEGAGSEDSPSAGPGASTPQLSSVAGGSVAGGSMAGV